MTEFLFGFAAGVIVTVAVIARWWLHMVEQSEP